MPQKPPQKRGSESEKPADYSYTDDDLPPTIRTIAEGYDVFKTLQRAFGGVMFIIMLVPGFICFIGYQVYAELAIEADCRRNFGPEWEHHYDAHYGTGALAYAHLKIVVGLCTIPVILLLGWLLYRQMGGKTLKLDWKRKRSGRRRKSRQARSLPPR